METSEHGDVERHHETSLPGTRGSAGVHPEERGLDAIDDGAHVDEVERRVLMTRV